MHFLEALGNFVYVVDIAKDELRISIISIIFETSSLNPVCLRIQLGPGIVDHYSRIVYHCLVIIRCPPNFHKHVLIIGRSSIVALSALGASPDRCARFFVVVG